MSHGQKHPLEIMRPQAEEILRTINPYCQRAAIAGSIRREVAWCGDIDIVCIAEGWALDQFLAKWMQSGGIRHVQRGPRGMKVWGDKTKAFNYDIAPELPPIEVELYITTPEQWAYDYLIRTGSIGFNLRMVTPQGRVDANGWPGLKPEQYYFANGRVNANGQVYHTEEEEDIFRMWGMEFVPPQQRNPDLKVKTCEVDLPASSSAIQQPSLF